MAVMEGARAAIQLLVPLLALTLLMAPSISHAEEQDAPPIAAYITAGSTSKLYYLDPDTILASITAPEPQLRIIRLNPELSIVAVAEEFTPLPAAAADFAVYRRGETLYIGVATVDGDVVIYDRELRQLNLLAVPTPPKRVFFLGTGLLVHAGESLYIIEPGALGWSEARVLVGDMIDKRLEGVGILEVEPISLTRIGMAREALLLYERVPAYTGRLQLLVLTRGKEGEAPASGAHILVYKKADNRTVFIGEGVAGSDGLAEIVIDLTQGEPTNLTLYIEYNGTCHAYRISSNEISLVNNFYVVTRPLVVDELPVYPICPVAAGSYRIAILTRSEKGFHVEDLKVNITSADIQILSAYRRGDLLYIWYTGRGLDDPLPDEEGVKLLVIDRGGRPVWERSQFYATPSRPELLEVSDDGSFVAFVAGNILYVAYLGEDERYRLVLSHRFAGARHIYVSYADGKPFIVAAADGPSRLLVASLANDTVRYTFGGPLHELKLDSNVNWISGSTSAIFLATGKGILAIERVLTDPEVTDVRELLIRNVTVTFTDALNGSLIPVSFTYRLVYQPYNVAVYEGEGTAENGRATLPCGPGCILEVEAKPLSSIYVGSISAVFNCSEVREGMPLNISVARSAARLRVVLVDGYTGGTPLPGTYKVNVSGVDTNYTVSGAVEAGEVFEVNLHAGLYRISVEGPPELYARHTGEALVVDSVIYEAILDRVPATVEIVVRVGEEAEPRDLLNITVTTLNGTVLHRVMAPAPKPDMPLSIRFATKYRGTAIALVQPIPGEGALSPYFMAANATFNVSGDSARAEIWLKPSLYKLAVRVYAGDTGEPLASIISVVKDGRLIAAVNDTSNAIFNLKRGIYTLHVAPLAGEGPFRFYANYTNQVSVGPDVELEIEAKRVRDIATVQLRDPLSPDGRYIDKLRVYIDDILFTEIEEGSNTTTLSLPVRVNGSRVVVESVKGLYSKADELVKPDNETVVVVLERKMFRVEINLVDDTGSPVAAATINVKGLNVHYSTSTVTDDEGSAVLSLPYGEYQLCFEAPGYLPECTLAVVQSDTTVNHILKPQPLTIVKRYMPLIVAVIIASTLVLVIRYYFKRIVERLAGEEEF